jgi:hypothetical protein
LAGLDEDDTNKVFLEYFSDGKFLGVSTYEWANAQDSEGRLPDKIVDKRQYPDFTSQPQSWQRA